MANSFIDTFLGNLQPQEYSAISRYLRTNIHNAEDSKTLNVFEQIAAGKEVQYKSPAALNKIKSRILEMGLDALMMDEEYLLTTFCEVDSILLRLKKDMLKCRILQLNTNENTTPIILNLLNRIIDEAKKNEIYPLLVEALTVKKYFVGNRTTIMEFERIDKELLFYKECEKLLFEATDNYHILILNQGSVTQLTKKQLDEHIKSSLLKLKEAYNNTESQQINYYLHIMEFAFYEQKKAYDKCIEICHKLLYLLKKHSLLYRVKRIGFAYNNLSLFYLLSNNYKKAEYYILKAENLHKDGSLEKSISLEEKFHIFFYQLKYKDANRCLEIILNQSLVDSGKFRKAKFIFYKAYLFFAKKEFKNAMTLLSKPLEVEKDKSVWSVSLRIFTIMLFIELDKISDASRTLEALRKYLDRHKLDEKIKKRDRLIVGCLRELEKNDFEYDPSNKTVSKIMKQLSARNSAVSWEHFSPELIPFQEWLGKKSVN